MNDMKPIHGIQVNFNIDMILFVDPPITTQDDRIKLQINIDTMKDDIKHLIEEYYNRTDWDDTEVHHNYTTYITDDNIDNYVQGEIYVMDE